MKTLIFSIGLLLCYCAVQAQGVELLSFRQNQQPCDSLRDVDWDNKIVESKHENAFFMVTILTMGYCDTNHYGSIKLDIGVLDLTFQHPDFPPDAGYISLNYVDKKKKIIEVVDCLCYYRMSYKIDPHGQTIKEITIKGRKVE